MSERKGFAMYLAMYNLQSSSVGLTLIHKSFIRPQDMFNGTWNEVSKTNIEEILKKMGYNWAVRKVAIAMGMTLVIKGLVLLFRCENYGSEFQIDV